MKERLELLGFDTEMVNSFTLSKIDDATTQVPFDIDACIEILKSQGLSENSILSEIISYHLDGNSFVETSHLYGRFHKIIDDQVCIEVEAENYQYDTLDQIISLDF